MLSMNVICFQVVFHPTPCTWRGTNSAETSRWEDVRSYRVLLLAPSQTENKADSFCENFHISLSIFSFIS